MTDKKKVFNIDLLQLYRVMLTFKTAEEIVTNAVKSI